MYKATQTRLSRLVFSAGIAGSLTFGGAQALSGSSTAVDGYVCTTRPRDPGCASYCLQQYPLNGGEHVCIGVVPGGWNCVCVQ